MLTVSVISKLRPKGRVERSKLDKGEEGIVSESERRNCRYKLSVVRVCGAITETGKKFRFSGI